MLIPKRVKYRKQFRGTMKGKAHKGNTVVHGEFGLQALEPAWITNRLKKNYSTSDSSLLQVSLKTLCVSKK